MSGNTVQARLRKLASREMRMLSKSDALLLQLAASMLDEYDTARKEAGEARDKAIRDACSNGALVSVARSHLAELVALLEAHQ